MKMTCNAHWTSEMRLLKGRVLREVKPLIGLEEVGGRHQEMAGLTYRPLPRFYVMLSKIGWIYMKADKFLRT